MLLMVWNDKFNIGISEIDEQHRMIFKILKQLRNYIKTGKPHNQISPLIEELFTNSDLIFKVEEKYMTLNNFYNREPHCLEHMVFLKRIRDFKSSFIHEDFISILQSLDFLIHWLTFHILESDKEFSEYKLS